MAAKVDLSTAQSRDSMVPDVDLPNSHSSFQGSSHHLPHPDLSGETAHPNFLEWIKQEMRRAFRKEIREAFRQLEGKILLQDFLDPVPLRGGSWMSLTEGLAPCWGMELRTQDKPDTLSTREEGELSEEEELVVTTMQTWLFPQDLYHKLLPHTGSYL